MSLPYEKPTAASLGVEIAGRAKPLNYTELFGDNRLLMLGESHSNADIRFHIAANAAILKAAGVTHYGIEVPTHPLFSQLNNGDAVEFKGIPLGPRKKGYEHAVRAMAAQGIEVVPIDIKQGQKPKPTHEQREEHIAQAIAEVLTAKLTSKFAVLIGASHATRDDLIFDSALSAAHRLTERGVSLTSAQIVGGIDFESTTRMFDRATKLVGLSGQEFMLDLRGERPEGLYFHHGIDYVIHLPKRRIPLTHRYPLNLFVAPFQTSKGR